MEYNCYPLGENAVLIELGKEINIETHQKIKGIAKFLNDNPPEWMIEYIPAFTTLTIYYEPYYIYSTFGTENIYEYVCKEIKKLLLKIPIGDENEPRNIEIPVCYGGDFGPDLEVVAEYNQLTPEEVIQIHSSGEYIVYMLGFAPGFPFIGGMSEKIATPRRKTPRLKIPERSVGIAGMQTGIYPIETPGGWQLIGRTPIRLFTPENNPPTLLMAGDKIKFTPISYEEYVKMENELL
ncbi:5-oxoprolinase subunit PxpB [Caldibacillus thermolactis]|uniref:5-oxoprolinase subunit PxpB n=1 Tax=Pallidibacillus thermolactis TaxID=251051 RepID=A0ABT2WCG7_9BACI|nr:5-oxoprolinase subunit PxpB [Pallidibacillus thermolactis]MCU9593370.1 5-oxoprolinase subunit PxpB [Pallidibacillus thermolactis]MCU9601515.1 5-oxoprolinase subunit PxpB [Pallidibacillus thermolactis subsp. kokeshiiformis]MED1672637.1 5-oxoprolinase subunit PxpB [Pallidibacillus thermolactis subsp. kokeshiiformis]